MSQLSVIFHFLTFNTRQMLADTHGRKVKVEKEAYAVVWASLAQCAIDRILLLMHVVKQVAI